MREGGDLLFGARRETPARAGRRPFGGGARDFYGEAFNPAMLRRHDGHDRHAERG
jgi:hypothetical protein